MVSTGTPIFLNEVLAEFERALDLHEPLNSWHEAYAVILEELEEFWQEAKKKDPDVALIRLELVQVATMAMRAVNELDLRAGVNGRH